MGYRKLVVNFLIKGGVRDYVTLLILVHEVS